MSPLFLHVVSYGVIRFLQVWKMAKNSPCSHAAVICLTCCIFLQAYADDLQCISGTYAKYGTMLRSHVFQEHNAENILACSLLCNSNIRCQSINYVISRHLCEMNSRTKEARPDDYLQDADRVYVSRPSERVPLGSIQEVPAASCQEIKASEGTSAVSGNYWLDSIKPGQVTLVSCDIGTGDIDECASGIHNCINGTANCINTIGSYKCACKSGYSGDGRSYCISDECKNYTTLSSANRKDTYSSQLPFKCDDTLKPGWFRFQGDAGTKMPTWCVPTFRCGTAIPGWLFGSHPGEDEGIVRRQVHFHGGSNCHYWYFDIQVKNCSGYYVYYLRKTLCNYRYCGTD
ncbi:fibulin-1-like [Acropora millepora]|uniref:fibulin-1-like n=1 Tax=Acropora millepora TaxID=45264 RepID=UPI001CF19134|nr:fibulin-1-like [Acropora millepora]